MSLSPIIDLPREVRDQIIGEVLFPGEEQPNNIGEQDRLGLAPTAVRQIFPYDTDDHRKPRFDVAILRTCRQLQHEGEWILYGTSSWNLMYQDWSDNIKLSYEFFEILPKRLRRLVRRVERKCYSRPYWGTISLHDWTMFMTFLARECPSLQSLKLWGPGDSNEGPAWVETCGKEEDWVQAILQIKTLKYFDIPVIRGGVIYKYPAFSDDFLPWLKASLIEAPPHPRMIDKQVPESIDSSNAKPFPLTKLEKAIRERIYRYVLLPPDKKIHPYIKPWYDSTTPNVIPLFLTCKQIHQEAVEVLYGEAIFTSPLPKYQTQLHDFLGGFYRTLISGRGSFYLSPTPGLNRTLRPLVKHVQSDIRILEDHFFCEFLTSCMDVTLHISMAATRVRDLNREWDNFAPNSKFLFHVGGVHGLRMGRLARFKNVIIHAPKDTPLNADCLAWMTSGVQEEFLHPSGDKRLRWLRQTLDPREGEDED